MEENKYSSWKIIKRLLSYYNKKKYLLLSSCILILFSIITEISSPIILSNFIANIIKNHTVKLTSILYLAISFITLQISSSLLCYFYTIQFNSMSTNIIKKIRIKILTIALQQPMEFFDKKPISSVITKITNDTESIKEFYDTILSSLIKNIVLFSMILITMFTLEWHMALITSIITPILILIIRTHKYHSKPSIQKIKSYASQLNTKINEIISGITVIQQFNQEKKFIKKIATLNKKIYFHKMQILKIDGILLRPLLNLISAILLSCIVMTLKLFPIVTLKISVLHAFINYLRYLNEPLVIITNQQSILQQVIVSSQRVFKFIDLPIQKYGEDTQLLQSGEIKIKNIYFSYPNTKKNILEKININIPDKSFIALVGKTGSGKTTLSNLISGYYKTTKGKIYLDKKPINTLSNKTLRKSISIVQQEPTIICDSLIKNISLGRNIKKKDIIKVIDKSQLKTLVNTLPKGYKSVLGKNGESLSQGQKQLIGIARILVSNPKILIFDEATASIDSESEQKIQKILSEIKKKSTVIVIAHRLSTVIDADMIIVLNKGKIIEKGKHKKLLKNKNLYYKMYKNQLKNK
ncbi:ABC transporter transmembrane domain-containing protein [Buchnera aphidicola]|uniref:Multidrug resistance-like ATP-binding protein MdlB n=1 Tax=Buchnera aphidicola (Cinara strobi) TaxID=1921549 RepID=A0A3B1E2S5_9GAMM|nr:ABC transporter transmembrane domain-containing protein [Buchnera aphidicola]VAX76750.1 Multidrug resistance-like ATP-binding protein MdlB [Buchnera aphidicola (Cinara strobi)]